MKRFASQDAVVRDLFGLERAEAYCRWLAAFMLPGCGKRLVELGSGTGNLTRYLLEGRERAWLLEVNPTLCARLRSRFGGGSVEVIQVDLAEGIPDPLVRRLQAEGVDTIVSSNVLEHLPEDLTVLRQAGDILISGGRTMHIVPALPWLFNHLDRSYGHVRRHTKWRIRAAARRQGWVVERLQYFNLSGMVGWAVGGWTGSAMRPAKVALFERFCLPVERLLARHWVGMPAGLSLFFSLRKA